MLILMTHYICVCRAVTELCDRRATRIYSWKFTDLSVSSAKYMYKWLRLNQFHSKSCFCLAGVCWYEIRVRVGIQLTTAGFFYSRLNSHFNNQFHLIFLRRKIHEMIQIVVLSLSRLKEMRLFEFVECLFRDLPDEPELPNT